jgi:phosphoglycolate phosphatase-like HAD superfamily hydrolase
MSGLREDIADLVDAISRNEVSEPTDAVLRVLAEHGDTEQVREQNLHEVVAEWHDRAVRAEAELVAARQQLDQVREVLARDTQTPLTRLVKAQAILDAPARPAGHDKTGQ